MARIAPITLFVVVVVFICGQCVSAMTPGTLRHQMQTAFARNKFLLPSKHWNQMVHGNVSEQCRRTYRNLSPILFYQYADAVGKPGSGVEKGNFLWMGSYSLCKSLPSSHYCLTDLQVQHGNQNKTKPITIRLGLCAPENCSESDVAYGLEDFLQVLGSKVKVDSGANNTRAVNCAKPSEYTTGPIVTIALCGFLLLLCLSGTLIDVIHQYSSSRQTIWNSSLVAVSNNSLPGSNGVTTGNTTVPVNDGSDSDTVRLINDRPVNSMDSSLPHLVPAKKNIVIEILLCFSILSNTSKIMDTKVPAGAITSLNGMRVLSMWWVILCHTFLWMFTSGVANNILSSIAISQRFSFQVINNGYFAVDSFFFLSGLLVSYLGLRRMEKTKGKLPIFKFYFHRFWRLTPSYMFVILFYENLRRFLGEGPLWFTKQADTQCAKYWWTNLLYINNFYPDSLLQECLGWSWYLANDMQFYIITPVFLIFMYRFKIGGLVASVGSVLWCSFIVTATLIRYYDMKVTLTSEIETGSFQKHDYSNTVYIKPYCRIAPYLVGIALGFVFHVQKNTSRKIPWIVLAVGWNVAVVLGLSAVYGEFKVFRKNGRPFSQAENLIYGTFSRFIWGLAIAWVIYVCHSGYGGIVNRILSARHWIPLSRLTYGAYLLHPIVLDSVFSSFQNTIAYTDALLVTYFLSIVVMAYMASYILAVCVEFPMMQLEKVFSELKSDNQSCLIRRDQRNHNIRKQQSRE